MAHPSTTSSSEHAATAASAASAPITSSSPAVASAPNSSNGITHTSLFRSHSTSSAASASSLTRTTTTGSMSGVGSSLGSMASMSGVGGMGTMGNMGGIGVVGGVGGLGGMGGVGKPSLLRSLSSMGSTGSQSSLAGVKGMSGGSTNSNSENLPPRTLARVARDVRDLVKNPPEGVRLVLDGETGMPCSLSEILAEIEGPEQTPYHTHYFQLKLVLSTDFPHTPPRGHFLTKIYHPNVDPTTGAICVNTLKKDWTPTTSLSHVLTVIRCLLIVPFPESSLNDEAGKNFMESYDEYARRAKLLAGVHGMKGWSAGARICGGKSDGGNDNDEEEAEGKKIVSGPTSAASTTTASSVSKPTNENVKLGGNGSRSNIVRSNSKALDKKNKKKSLKRL